MFYNVYKYFEMRSATRGDLAPDEREKMDEYARKFKEMFPSDIKYRLPAKQ